MKIIPVTQMIFGPHCSIQIHCTFMQLWQLQSSIYVQIDSLFFVQLETVLFVLSLLVENLRGHMSRATELI